MKIHETAANRADLAQANFEAGLNCAQSVLLAFSPDYGMSEVEAKRTAAVFGAGMGRLQETCGALTGAFMALGLAHGFIDPRDQAGREKLLLETKDLAAGFKAEFGSHNCRDILQCDLNTAEGQQFHKDTNQRGQLCTRCIRLTAANLQKILST